MARHEVTIGENIYYISRFEPFTALEILGDLQKQFAGPFLGVVNGKESATDEEKAAAMMQAFKNLSSQMDGKTLRALAERLIDKEYIAVVIGGDGQPRKLDKGAMTLAFENVSDIIQLCWEIVQFNYAEVIARISNPTGPAARIMTGSR